MARLQGARSGYASEIIARGNALGIGDPEVLEWFKKHKFIDDVGDPTAELYWRAIADEVLLVEYIVKVDNGRPHFVLQEASVTTGPITTWTGAVRMAEHMVALGLCRGERLRLDESRGIYRVVHR